MTEQNPLVAVGEFLVFVRPRAVSRHERSTSFSLARSARWSSTGLVPLFWITLVLGTWFGRLATFEMRARGVLCFIREAHSAAAGGGTPNDCKNRFHTTTL